MPIELKHAMIQSHLAEDALQLICLKFAAAVENEKGFEIISKTSLVEFLWKGCSVNHDMRKAAK